MLSTSTHRTKGGGFTYTLFVNRTESEQNGKRTCIRVSTGFTDKQMMALKFNEKRIMAPKFND